MRPERGTVLADRYELIEPLASGGMGDVWRGVDRVLGRDVAVKVLRADAVADSTFLTRFRAEARLAAMLSHPGIATVFDYGEHDGRPFLVMELVAGEPLSARLAREGPMAPDEVTAVLVQVADALAAAHSAGIVHRDVKPGNIMLTPADRVKLTDFGIAKAVGSATVTATGFIVGTAQYLAPEQATGGTVSPASDVYSLGVVAFEMLSGRPPFTGDSHVAIAMAQVHDSPPALPASVPAGLAAVVRDSMAKAPAQRPADGAAVAARLRATTASAPGPTAVPVVAGASTRLDIGDPIAAHRSGRRAVLVASLAAVALAAVAGVVVAAEAFDRDPAATTTPAAATTAAAASTASATTIATTTTTSTTTAPTTAPATTTVQTEPSVEVVADLLVGKRADDVVDELEDAGLLVEVVYVEAERRDRGKVVAVEPTGAVPEGSTVVVSVGEDRPKQGDD